MFFTQNDDYFSQLVDRHQSLNLAESTTESVPHNGFCSVPDLKLTMCPLTEEIKMVDESASKDEGEHSSEDEVMFMIVWL